MNYLSEFDSIDVDTSEIRETTRVSEFLPSEEILDFVCDISESNNFKIMAVFCELEELFECWHMVVHIVKMEFADSAHVDTADEIVDELIRLVDDLRRK